MICLDELLYGSPAWAEVALFFKDGEFQEEHYTVEAINKHLITNEQKQRLFESDLSIQDMLNGRCYSEQEAMVNAIYNNWNKKLGFKCFGL